MQTDDFSVFDNMMEGIQVIDRDWRYKYVNDAVVRQSLYSREELLGHTMMEKYPGIEQTELFEKIGRCMKERLALRMLNEFNFPDGSKGYFDVRLYGIRQGVLILSYDISNEKNMSDELRRLNEELEQRVKDRTAEVIAALEREREMNVLKTRFLSMASHEFRTPLSTILSSIALIDHYNGPDLEQKKDKHVERIRSAVKNLTSILDEFLSLDKLEQGKISVNPSSFNLREFVAGLVEEVSDITKANQQITFSYSGPEETFLDGQILRNVLLNLLSNAIKYSDSGISVDARKENDTVTISVTDHGIGIPEEEQALLFEKYFRAKNARNIQGTGLGLHIVNRYVELMGGTLTFRSNKEGTTFTATLPG